MWYLILSIGLAIWVGYDAKGRQANFVGWTLGSFLLSPVILPLYFAIRPLKSSETREGGTAWNLMKNFSIVWTLLMAVAAIWSLVAISQQAPTTNSEAEQAGFAIGATLGFGMIGALWFFPVLGALVLGLFLKKSNLTEKGPTGRNIDSDHPAQKENAIIPIAVSVALILILFYIGASMKDKNESRLIENQETPSQGKGYLLKPKESALLAYLLKDESKSLQDGEDTMLADRLQTVTAIEIAKAYESNQVAADQKYYQKIFRVEGKIESINSGLDNEPYINFRGANMFQSPQAYFKKPDIQRISSLKKGQKIVLICNGGGSIIGTPTFQKCLFADDYATQEITKAKNKIEEFLAGKPQADQIGLTTIMGIALARALPEDSSCFSNTDTCGTQLNTIMKETVDIQNIATSVAAELKAHGIPLPDLKPITEKKPKAANN